MIKLLLLLHRWTGIVLAGYVVMMGVTGTALVLHDEAARSFRMPPVSEGGGPPLDVDRIATRIGEAFPDWHLQTIWWPDAEYQPAWFAEIRRGAVGTIGEAALAVYVDPRSGRILRTHDYSRSPWRWMQLLHFNLLSGLNGRQVNGCAGARDAVLCADRRAPVVAEPPFGGAAGGRGGCGGICTRLPASTSRRFS